MQRRPRRARIFPREINPLDAYTENELRSRYRFGRAGINYIVPSLKMK